MNMTKMHLTIAAALIGSLFPLFAHADPTLSPQQPLIGWFDRAQAALVGTQQSFVSIYRGLCWGLSKNKSSRSCLMAPGSFILEDVQNEVQW